MTKQQIIENLEALIAIERAEAMYWSRHADWKAHDIAQNRLEAFTEALEMVKQLEGE